MLSDALLYSEYHSMQDHDTKLFLSSIVQKMDWKRQEQDTVMDIGCGPGDSSLKLLLPAFPKVKKMIAVDVLPDMIDFAREKNASDKIEYHVADIGNWGTLEKFSEQISKVISIYCLHWLDDQEEGFRNIYRLLKPEGEAALLIALDSPFWDSYKLLVDNPKWSEYLKDANQGVPQSHFQKFGASHYRDLLENMGFDVAICEDEKRIFTYPSDENCRVATLSRSALSSYIPDNLKSEFNEDLFQGFVKFNGRSSDGRPQLHYTTLTILIQKPNA